MIIVDGNFNSVSYLQQIIISIIFQAEMDSIQSFYNADSKKLTQLNVPSRYIRSQSDHMYYKISYQITYYITFHFRSHIISCPTISQYIHTIRSYPKPFRQPGDISFFSRTDPIGEYHNILRCLLTLIISYFNFPFLQQLVTINLCDFEPLVCWVTVTCHDPCILESPNDANICRLYIHLCLLGRVQVP